MITTILILVFIDSFSQKWC